MRTKRVAIVFDNVARPDTTGVYCRRALGKLADVEHFLPTELGRIPRRGFDLYLNIDDGLEYRWPSDLRPSAWWAIDTHMNLPWYLKKGNDFDLVFTAQRDGAQQLRQAGISASWLALACDPEIHCKYDVPKNSDLCFIGHVFPGPRQELLELLQKEFPGMFIGQQFFGDMARTYSAARIVFNRSLRNDVNMRVFEALACGSLLLTNDLRDNGQEELFQSGVHLETYREQQELIDKVRFYLDHPAERERIAAAGRTEALANHTYHHRMSRVLSEANSHPPRPTMIVPGTIVTDNSTADNSTADNCPLPGTSDDYSLTSIVILTHNELAYTRQCVDSIRRHTREPYELVFVDNASTDGTLDYLRSQSDIRLIANAENRGFPAAANQGIQAARGSQVLLLNNDTIVTPGWLTRLLDALDSAANVGLVGPCSNNVSGEQQVSATYDDPSGLDEFARTWARANGGQVVDTDRLVGFCLLIRREVLDQVGLLDERFGLGCFEDDDYCRRVLKAGYRAVIARTSFVHHFGGRTFLGSNVDYAVLMQRNQALFEEKWTADKPGAASGDHAIASPGQLLAPFGLEMAPGGGLLLKRRELTLSLCMIVRDNAKTIGACLRSIRPWVDEMIVVDTGSRDDTPKIAASLGARVFHFAWPDSFAIARNESLRHARGKWIFWMDSDDTIDATNGRQLRELVRQNVDPSVLGFIMQVHCPGPGAEGQNAVTVVDHLKLFRNLPELRFEHRIHEQIIPAIRRAGGEVAWTDIFVVHSGYDHSPEGQERKKQRDLRLLHMELDEQPNHPFTLFNLGMTCADVGEHAKAIEFLRRSIANSLPDESHLRKAYALLAHSLQQTDCPDESWQSCQDGLRLFPQDAELLFRKAGLLYDRGRLREAAQVYQNLLQIREEPHFKSVVRGIQSFLARQNLALVYADMGNLAQAEREWRLVVEEVPAYRPGWHGLGENLILQGKIREARSLAEHLLHQNGLGSLGRFLKAQVSLAQGNAERARQELERAVKESPEDVEALEALCRFLFERVGLPHAEGPLRELLRRDPTNGSAYHNLGSALAHQARWEEAVQAFQQSVRHRPRSPVSHCQLGYVLQKCGRLAEARAAWEETLRIDPGNSEAREALGAAGSRPQAGQENQETRPLLQTFVSQRTTRSLHLRGRIAQVPIATRGPVDLSIVEAIWLRDAYGVRFIEPPSTVADIGAHIGVYSLMAAEAWPRARIIACEPDEENFLLLTQNLSDRRNIDMVRAAILGDDRTEVDFNAVPDKFAHNSGGGSAFRHEPHSVKTTVPALSALRLWQEKNVHQCDLLKLDCEGAEIPILQMLAAAGLLATIKLIVGEWHTQDSGEEASAKVKAELRRILGVTHEVSFLPDKGGKEGYFTARRLRKP